MFDNELPTENNEKTTSALDNEAQFIQEQQVRNPDLLVEAISVPKKDEPLTSATFRQITQRLLPTIQGFEGITPQQIAAMNTDQLAAAVARINETYIFRGVVVSLSNSDIEYVSLPDAFSGETVPSTHTIKSLPTVLREGDTMREGNSTFAGRYWLDGDSYDANKFIGREIDYFQLSMAQLENDDPTLREKSSIVAPAVLVFKQSHVQSVRKYRYDFKSSETGGNPKREALAAAFVIPRATRIPDSR